MFGFFEKSQTSKKEVRMPALKPVNPENVPAEFRAGGVVPSTGTDQLKQFTGYETLDGELIDGKTEIDRFNAARGFGPVEGASNTSVIPETPQQEATVSTEAVEFVDGADAGLIRQQALEIPKGLEGEALAVALEAKRDEFKRYFEEKWKGKMWKSNPEKDADLECLAVLQGRAAGARRGAAIRESIAQAEGEQTRADILSVQQAFLAELNKTPVAEAATRRQISSEIARLGALLKSEHVQMYEDVIYAQLALVAQLSKIPVAETDIRGQIRAEIMELADLLKPGNEQDLRVWREKRSSESASFPSTGKDGESEWSR
jgi:hypothetical protein